jgi:hypothetical protein
MVNTTVNYMHDKFTIKLLPHPNHLQQQSTSHASDHQSGCYKRVPPTVSIHIRRKYVNNSNEDNETTYAEIISDHLFATPQQHEQQDRANEVKST